MKRLLLAVLAVAISLTAAAQQRIRGKVTDQDGKPLANVLVQDKESGISTLSNSEGQYQMPIIKQRKVTYLFSCKGYENREVEITGQTAGEVSTSLNKLEPQTLYVVDGRISSQEEVDALKPETIANMNVMKGIDHAVIINTRKPETDVAVVSTEPLTWHVAVDKRGEEEGAVPFMLVNGGEQEVATSVVTIDKSKGVEITDNTGGKSIRIIKQGNEVTLNNETDVLVVVRNTDGTLRTGKIELLKEISPNVIRTITVLKDERARELLREHKLDVELPADGAIWVELGQPEMRIYKAKVVN